MLEALDKKFIARYAKQFAVINSKLNVINVEKDGTYLSPTVVLGDGGATVVTDHTKLVYTLAPAAKVVIDYKKVEPHVVFYRIAFSLEEAGRAVEDDNYFNFIMDPTLNRALEGYFKAFGTPDAIRFGKVFCEYRDAANNNAVFRMTEEGGGMVEFRLTGHWASAIEVASVS